MQILLTDSSAERRALLRAQLAASAHLEPCDAETPEAALALLARGGVDLVLVDCRAGGISAVRQLARASTAPVVALVGGEVEARDAIEAGAARVLSQGDAALTLAIEVELLVAWGRQDHRTTLRRELAEVRALVAGLEPVSLVAPRTSAWSLDALQPRERSLLLALIAGAVAVAVVAVAAVVLAWAGVDVGQVGQRLVPG